MRSVHRSRASGVRPEEIDALPGRIVRRCASFRLLRQDWALADDPDTTPIEVLESARYVVCWRAERSVAVQVVPPGLGRLCTLVDRLPLGDALAALADQAGANTQAIAEALPRWVDLALRSGWWVGTCAP